jgi:hypothetical protein
MTYCDVNSILNRPWRTTYAQSVIQRVLAYTGISRQSGKRVGLPSVLNTYIGAAVVGLFKSCRPSAVVRRIAFVVVNALQCCTGWSAAHISKKNWKRFPAITYADVSLSVMERRPTVFRSAPTHHMYPGTIGRALHWPSIVPFGVPVCFYVVPHAVSIACGRRDKQ